MKIGYYISFSALIVAIMLLVNYCNNRKVLREQQEREKARREYASKMLEQATEEYVKYQKLARDCAVHDDMLGYKLNNILARRYKSECITYLYML